MPIAPCLGRPALTSPLLLEPRNLLSLTSRGRERRAYELVSSGPRGPMGYATLVSSAMMAEVSRRMPGLMVVERATDFT